MAILRDNWIIIATAAAVIVALALLWGIWWVWWRLPKWQVARLALKIRDPKARAEIEDNFRKTVGQALGGAAVLIGAVVAYLQFTQQQQTSHNQLQAAHDLLISNQVAKGFEQLAGKETAMRLGGIYGLEGVMNGSAQYHQPVLEALCAFVRDGTMEKVSNKPATDIQAALTVIGRRTAGPGNVSFNNARIPGATLEFVNLRDADLRHADLSYADLFNANLRDADLNQARLESAFLLGANLSYANMSETDLTAARLLHVNLFRAFLNHANLSNAILWAIRACEVHR